MMSTLKKTYITLAITVITVFLGASTATAAYKTDVVSDMALIYQGGNHRPEWTEDELRPYVVHTFADGRMEWFFDSFLFFEFTDSWQIAFGSSYGTRNAQRSDWEWLLNRVFEKGKSLDALNSCIEHYKTIIGEPSFKHRIVLGVVSPITGQTDWGSLDGKTLDFTNRDDQITAAKWYIDQLMERFAEETYNNLELTGFYWLEESTAKCGDLPKDVSEYIHQLDKRFYWIPYWGSDGHGEWKELKFDVAYQQPNYFFYEQKPDSMHLKTVCEFAKEKGMYLEVEFDERALKKSPDYRADRLHEYMEAYEKYGALYDIPLAYYIGDCMVYDLATSSYKEDNDLYNWFADIVVKRQHIRGEK